MRLDKFLKVSRLIKRRTVAADACSAGKVSVNGKVAKPSTDVKAGDRLDLTYGERVLSFEILSVADFARKEDADSMYKAL